MVKSVRLETERGEGRFSEEYVSLIMDSLVIPTESFGYQVAEPATLLFVDLSPRQIPVVLRVI